MNWNSADFPSFEEGSLRPTNKCHATLEQGAAGEVRLTSPAAPMS
jgi:hypothetical protein